MLSSGETAIATTTDDAVTAIANTGKFSCNYLTISNEGGVAGFFSIDGGTTWGRIAATGQTICRERFSGAVLVKRVSGGSNLGGLYAFAGVMDVRG